MGALEANMNILVFVLYFFVLLSSDTIEIDTPRLHSYSTIQHNKSWLSCLFFNIFSVIDHRYELCNISGVALMLVGNGSLDFICRSVAPASRVAASAFIAMYSASALMHDTISSRACSGAVPHFKDSSDGRHRSSLSAGFSLRIL